MSITKILSTDEKKLPADEKLAQVADVVAGARESYGNEGVKIEVPMCQTAHGEMPFDSLEDDSKVVVLRDQAAFIKVAAVEYAAQNTGTNVNKKIEELLATNGFFANVASGTKFELI